ncbi:NFACT RNA binding domain-containing protein [Geothrix sp. PMB-07]|uniref:NFACT RNA binding domain-containing protein n=1 Tax=Geothrix sp. PMB-07 TaxID=3068640 RepID=UPI00274128D7|nr:NFACT RNA binding domain-containing protein [Geothrix sp. PMB-07]WLT32011.1 NFACT RNA binding domain-containing protein [Geothrix sp. PMB-07]
MEAPLLLALARAWGRERGDLPLDGVWASSRAVGLRWAGRKQAEGWVLLLQPKPELWLLAVEHPAWKRLQAEAPKDSAKLWGPWFQGARLREVQGDPRERWLGLVFQRRAITGRLETLRLAFQAIPGRPGIRVDGLDTQVPRLGLGSPFPSAAPEPVEDTPPFRRWRERWADRLDMALAGLEPEVLEGEGGLLERHRAWSEARAESLILGPALAAAERKRQVESARLDRLGQALGRDRAKHEAQIPLKDLARRVSAELYRLKGATREVQLLEGERVALPEGASAEHAVQGWFTAAKKAERGLARVAELEAELARERAAWAARAPLEAEGLAPELSAARQTKEKAKGKAPAKEKGAKRMQADGGKRKDGKGTAFRSVMVDGFEVLIGKGDAENDQLTFKVADNLDFWLHVASVPGSHVVIRNPDKLSELPRTVIERAAELAAYHSKARDGGKVEVHLARIADISKPRGYAAGKVILKKWTGIRVYPKP